MKIDYDYLYQVSPPLSATLASELPRLFVVAPAFNEAPAVTSFLRELAVVTTKIVAKRRLHVVIVDDGSSDDTALRALEAAEEMGLPLSLVRLARNFGQQAAFQAGMQHAFQLGDEADVFALMDSDLQHPPSLLVSMLREMENGVDHVQMLRNADEALPFFKRLTSDAFYRLLKLVSGLHSDPGASDFRMFSYRFLAAYLKFNEVNRFNRAIFMSLGFRTAKVRYSADKRHSGVTKYSLVRMVKLGLAGIIQFTNAPLILGSLATFALSALVCVTYAIVELVAVFRGAQFAIGWPTIIFFIFFWGGLLSFNQLMSSLYLASIYNEAKNRPVFIIESIQSIPKEHNAVSGSIK